jgi:hypothetical protein
MEQPSDPSVMAIAPHRWLTTSKQPFSALTESSQRATLL